MSVRPVASERPALPDSYGRSRVVVLPIDPHHVHAYWEVTPADAAATLARLDRSGVAEPKWVLRFHDVTGGDLAHFDIDIDPDARNWYVELWSPDKTYLVELGVRCSNQFSVVCQANPVHVPPATSSQAAQAEWAMADLEHATSHALAAGDPRVPPTTRSQTPGAPEHARASGEPAFAGEQPWITAIRQLSAVGTERAESAEIAAAAEAPPTSKTPPTRASTPHALAFELRGTSEVPGPSGEPERAGRSRSVSLRGVGAGSGALDTLEPAPASSGDSHE